MYKSLFIFTIFVSFAHCRNSANSNSSNTCLYQKLDFSVMLPCGAKHEDLNSIDSQAGRFTWNNYTLIYDKMHVEIPVKCITDSVYLVENLWLHEAVNILPLKQNVEYSVNSLVEKIKVINLDIHSKKATFMYENQRFEYTIPIHEEIANTQYVHDFVNSKRVLFKIKKNPDATRFSIKMYTSMQKSRDKYYIYQSNGTSFDIQNVSQKDSLSIMGMLKNIKIIN